MAMQSAIFHGAAKAMRLTLMIQTHDRAGNAGRN